MGCLTQLPVAAWWQRPFTDAACGVRRTGAQRSRIIHKFADLLEANLEELAQLETLVTCDVSKGRIFLICLAV